MKSRGRYARRNTIGRWPLAVALAAAAALALTLAGDGASAERTAAVSAPTLESLLQQRDGATRGAVATPPSVEDLRARYEELRARRADIEGSLPPALRTPPARRPELREVRAPVDANIVLQRIGAVDAGTGDADGVGYEAAR